METVSSIQHYKDFIVFKIIFFSSIAPSSPPVNVSVYNVTSTEILIQWLPPKVHHRNGVIRGYFIQLWDTVTGQSLQYELSSGNSSLMVPGLHPAYTYVVEMAAKTILEGPFSEDIYVVMDEDGEILTPYNG